MPDAPNTHPDDPREPLLLGGNDQAQGQGTATVGSGLELAAIWSAVYRLRYWVGGIVAACLLLGIVISILSTPIFEAEASVQIDQEAAKVIGTEDNTLSSAVQSNALASSV